MFTLLYNQFKQACRSFMTFSYGKLAYKFRKHIFEQNEKNSK